MSSIFVGSGLGLFDSSLTQANGFGSDGKARVGQGNDLASVNAATGNLVIQSQDDYLASVGLSNPLVRTYNSLGQTDGDNNDGWRLSVYRSLDLPGALAPHGTITRTSGDGHVATFKYDATRIAGGGWFSVEGSGADDFILQSGSQWVYTEGSSRVSETYDATGKLLSTRDANGNTTTFTYDAGGLGLVTAIQDSQGQVAYLDYTGTKLMAIRIVGLIPGATATTQTQSITRVRYTYDTSDRLQYVKVDLTPQDGVTTDGKIYTTQYDYDGTSDRVAKISQFNGDPVVSGVLTSSLTITYKTVGLGKRVDYVLDGDGNKTTFSYSTFTRKTTVTDPLNIDTVYDYDASDRLVSLDLPAVNGSTASILYGYDTSDNVTQVTDASGRVTQYGYGTDNTFTQSRDALGNQVDLGYDANGLLISRTTYASPGVGTNPPPASSAQVTHYAYDAKRNLRFVVSAEGQVTEYQYDPGTGVRKSAISYTGAIYPASATDFSESALSSWTLPNRAKSQRTDTAYDLTGQVKTVTTFASVDSAGLGVVDSNRSVRQYVYDVSGRLLISTDPQATSTTPGQARVTSYLYDGLDRQISFRDGSGRITATVYGLDASAHTTLTTTTPAGLVTTTVLDGSGQTISVTQSGPGVPAGGTTTYDYDADDRLVRTTDPTGQKTYSVYDTRGRQTGIISAERELTENVYNAAGQVIAQIRYAGLVTAALSDAPAAPSVLTIDTVRPVANAAADRTARNYYDDAGRLQYAVDAAGYLTGIGYDGAGRKISQTQYFTALSSFPASGNADDLVVTLNAVKDRTTRYFYDRDGRSTGSLDAAGYLTETVYNAAGAVQQIIAYATATAAAQRVSGTLSQLRPALDAAHDRNTWFYYDGKGQLAGQLDAEGYLSATQYDISGNVLRQTRYGKAVSYNASTTLATLISQATQPNAALANHDQATVFTYDTLNRIVTETDYQSTITQYNYDAVTGFLTSTKRAAGAALGGVDDRTTTNRYDALGRVTGTLNGEGSIALAAAGADPVAQANVYNTAGTQSVYDSAGRRIKSTDAKGHATYFYYDGDSRLRYSVVDADSALYSGGSGEVTGYGYDAFGDVLSTTQYANRINTAGLTGGLVTSTFTALITAASSSTDRTTTATYGDKRGLLTQSQDATGAVTTQSYDPFAALASRITNQGTATAVRSRTDEYVYDARGLYTQTTEDVGGLNLVTQVVTYDAFGRATETKDPNGNTRTTQYDRLGRTVLTSDGFVGKNTTTAYDAFSRVLSVTDRNNQVTQYSYNDSTRTLTVNSPEQIKVVTTSNRFGQTLSVSRNNGTETVSYSYDHDGNLRYTQGADPAFSPAENRYDSADRLITSIDERGTQTTYSYDGANRILTRTVDPTGLNLRTQYQYNAFGNAIKVTDANGVSTETQYNKNGQTVAVIVDTVDRAGQPTALKIATVYTLDAQSRRLSVFEGIQATGTSGALVADSAAVIATAQRRTDYGFDNEGRRVSEAVDPAGLNLVTSYAYDKNGNLSRKTEPSSDGNVRTTRYFYDANDRQLYSVDALGYVVQSRYDSEDRVVQTIGYANAISNYAALTDSSLSSSVAPVSNASDRISRSVYDNDGRLAYAIDGVGAVVGYGYDDANRVTSVTTYAVPLTDTQRGTLAVVSSPAAIEALLGASNASDQITLTDYFASGTVKTVTDAQNYIQRYTYDGAGNKISYTNQNNATWTYTYDRANRLTDEKAPAVNVSTVSGQVLTTVSKQLTTRLAYDGVGNLTYRVENFDSSAPGNARVTRYAYDALGRQTQTTTADNSYKETPAGPAYGAQVKLYDPTSDNAAGNIGVHETAAQSLTSTVFYDRIGNAYAAKDVGGIYSYKVYDKAGRVSHEVDADLYVTAYQYDSSGNQTAITRYANGLPTGHANATAYTAADIASGLVLVASAADRTITTAYDALSRKTKVVQPSVFSYDATSKTSVTTSPTTNFTYNAFGNVVQQSELRSIVGGVSNFDTTTRYYDRVGNQVAEIDPAGYLTQRGYTVSGQVASSREWSDPLAAGSWTATSYTTPTFVAAVADGAAPTTFYQSAFPATTGLAATPADALGTNFAVAGSQLVVRDTQAAAAAFVALNGNTTYTGQDATATTFTYDFSFSSGSPGVRRLIGIGNWNGSTQSASTFGFYLSLTATSLSTLEIDGTSPAITGGAPLGLAFNQNYRLEFVTDSRGATMYLYAAGSNRGSGYQYRFDSTATPTAIRTQIFASRTTTAVSEGVFNVSSIKVANGTESTLSAGTLAARRTSNVRETLYSYDRLDRQTSATRTGVINTRVETDGRISASVGNQTTLTRYDGVGNVIATTDAAQYALDPATPSTLSFYDALGRQVAATVTQDATTSRLTTTAYDAYGNAIAQTQYVNGTTRRTAQTTLADLPSARLLDALNDVSSYSSVDVLGRVTSTIDAIGARTDLSYNAYGKVVKTENAFARLDGSTGRRIQILSYNGRGLQTEEASRLESGNLARRTTGYNAFGEVTDRGLAGGDQADVTAGLVGTFERYRYDNNGRLVYDNRDGSNTVYLSDLKGNVTAQIKSPTVDLSTYFTAANATNSPSAVASLSVGIRRSESVYDLLGRVIEQRDVSFSESTFQLGTSIVVSYSAGVNTLNVPNNLPLGATPTLRIAPVGTSNWINVPLQLPVTNGGYGPWSGVVAGNPPAGVYRYELAHVIAGQSVPVAAGSGQIQLAGPRTDTSPIGVTTQMVSGVPYYVFQSNDVGVSLAGMTSIKLFTEIVSGAPSGTPTPANQSSAAQYAVVDLGGGRYGVPVPDGGRLYKIQPVGTAVSDVYTVNFTTAPTPGGTAQALISALFQGKIPISAIRADLRVALFEQKSAGSSPDQSYTTPPPGKINATTDGPPSLAYLTANGYAENYDFRVRFTDAAGNTVNLSSLMVNGQPVGDAQGFVRGTFGSVARPIDATASNIRTVTYTPTTSRTLDRWGNVLSQTLTADVKTTDGQGTVLTQSNPDPVFSTVSYRYDEFDRTIQQRLATTSAVTNRGISYTVTPTSETAFDAAGRVIAQTDANFNLSRQSHDLAGDVLSQTDGSGATTRFGYDTLGRQVSRTSPLNQVVTYRYDRRNQLISEQDTVRAVATTYAYDALGNRVNDNNQITYVYDGYGHVLSRSLNAYTPAGGSLQQQRTTYVYDALGRQTRQTDANGNFTSTLYDAFGRRMSETVLSNGATAGNTVQYRYNLANDKTDDIYTVGGLNRTRYYTYYANGLLKSSFENDAAFYTSQAPQLSDYAYDAAGRVIHARTQEYGGVSGDGIQDTIYTYDEAGRLSKVTDPRATVTYGYDAAGNRKLVTSRIPNLQKTNPIEHRYRYDYDGANRVQTVVEADLIVDASGVATGLKNASGQTFQFDANGNRVFQQDYTQGTNTHNITAGSGEAGIYAALTAFATPARAGQTLVNSFDARNRLTEVRTGTGGTAGPVTSRRAYDNSNALDQVLDYTTYNSSGAQIARQHNLYYADGTLREVQNYNSSNAYAGANQYSYDKAGNLTRTRLVNASNSLTGTYDYSYIKGRRGYQQSLIAATTPGNSTVNNTVFTYNAWDELNSSGNNTGGGLTTITARYSNDNAGRVLLKIAGIISPTVAYDFFLYQGDNALGSAEIIDYTTAGVSTSHFGFNFTPISSQYPAITPGTYVVQAGDSLPGIAQAIYGDASLWYLIADANPTFQNASLTAGTVLQLPNSVIASKNNSTTFKPFSAQELIGDVTPPLPPPPAAKSNIFATVVIAVVAAAAAVVGQYYVGPLLFGSGGVGAAVGAGATAGALSSTASQLAGLALGVQNNFSFSAVGRGALVGGLSAGITDGISSVDIGLKGPAAQAFQAAVSTTATQSVNIALGYQNNFSFAAVAASAVAAGLVPAPAGLGNSGLENPGDGSNSFGRFASDFGRNLARNGLRNSVQIALEGGGKINFANIAGDAFGNALGNAIVREIKTSGATRQQRIATHRVEIAVEEAARTDIGQASGDLTGTTGDVGARGSPSSVSLSAEEFDSLVFSGRLGTPQFAESKLEQLGIQRATDGGPSGLQTFAAAQSFGTVSSRSPAPPPAAPQPFYQQALNYLDQRRASDQAFFTGNINNAQSGAGAVINAIGRSLNNAGYDIAQGGAGLIGLATDGDLRGRISNSIGTAIGNIAADPLGSAAAAYAAGANYLGNTSTQQIGEEALRLLAGGLAIDGLGRVALSGVRLAGGVFVDGLPSAGGFSTLTIQTGAINLGSFSPAARAGLRTSAVISPERATQYLLDNIDHLSLERAQEYIGAFDGPITARLVRSGEDFGRYANLPEGQGSFLTKQIFPTSQDAVDGLYLEPYGNNATFRQTVVSTQRSIVLEGGITNGGAGIKQTLVINRGAFDYGTGIGY